MCKSFNLINKPHIILKSRRDRKKNKGKAILAKFVESGLKGNAIFWYIKEFIK